MSNIGDGLVGLCLGEKSSTCLGWPPYVGQPGGVVTELVLIRKSLRTLVKSSSLCVLLCAALLRRFAPGGGSAADQVRRGGDDADSAEAVGEAGRRAINADAAWS
jgi:hypothetical protein